MARPSLRRLAQRARVGQLLADVAPAFGYAAALLERDGSLVVGTDPPPASAPLPLLVAGEHLGFVAAAEHTAALASLLAVVLAGELERRALSDETLERYKELNFLYTFAERLGGSLGRAETATLVREEAEKLFRAEVAAVLLRDDDWHTLEPVSTTADRPPELAALLAQRDLIDRVIELGRPELVEELEPTTDGLGALMCAPLRSAQHTIGVIAVGVRGACPWRSGDVKLLASLAAQAAAAIENALLHERKVQEELLKSRLSRYVSPQLVEALLKDGESGSMASERRRIAVLFSDIRNFSTTAETLAPELLVRHLNEYFTEMVAVIFDHEGTVNKFVGDMIMALFGAPAPLPHNERQAIEAAIRMQRRLRELDNAWIGQHFPMGIGINAGDVVVGNIGSPQHMDYTAIGDDVNVAARLQGIARAGQVLVSRSVAESVHGEFEFREVGQVPVKGKSRPIEVFEVLF